jgi:prephenate dehydrogenase
MNGIRKIAILGGGLLGGSLALALQHTAQVRVWCRRVSAAEEARALGLFASVSLAEVVAEAGLVILCVPVGVMQELLIAAQQAGLPSQALVTDVGSVKSLPHQALRGICTATGVEFIGSHPMAGGEKGGIQHAKANLFEGAACILTNDFAVDAKKCEDLEHFWQALGCHTTWMTAAAHDALVARISHFPRLLASVGIKVALLDVAFGAQAGGGLRDTTRVAAGNPEMWTEILAENRDAILPTLHEALRELRQITEYLEHDRRAELHEWLSQTKELRDGLG